MKCSWVRKRLMAYAENDADDREMLAIREHLRVCSQCSAESQVAQEAIELLRELRTETPAPNLLHAVREKIAAQERRTLLQAMPRVAVVLSVFVVLGVAIGVNLLTQAPSHRALTPAVTDNGTPVVKKEPAVEASRKVEKPEKVSEVRSAQVEKPVGRQIPRTYRVAKKTKQVTRPAENVADPAAEPEISDESGSQEPAMLFVLQPREPESYIIVLGAEEESPASRVSIVREFNTAGEVTSVTIDQNEIPDLPASDMPQPNEDLSPPTQPADETGVWLDLGGFTENA